MIQKGLSSRSTKFVAKKNGDIWDTSGSPSAFFGYKVTSQQDNSGIWAEWFYKGNRFEFKNDRYGFYPMYYFNTENGFGISPSVLELLKNCDKKELDDAAISVFLRCGFYIGSDTPFRNIRAVPPGCTITWEDGNLQIEENKIHFNNRPISLSRESAVNEYGSIFQSVMHKYLPDKKDKAAILLSGGRDSRHILFALLKDGYKPCDCISMKYAPPKVKNDAEISSKLCTRLGIHHTVIDPPIDIFQAKIKRTILTNFCADEHDWILPAADYAKNKGFTYLFDGIGGDILSAGIFLNKRRLDLYELEHFRELAAEILGPEEYIPKILLQKLYARWNSELAISHLEIEIRKYSNTMHPIGQFYFWNKTRREAALSPWSIMPDTSIVLAPYMDNEIYNFLSSLPAGYFLSKSFHTESIERFYPEYAGIPYASNNGLMHKISFDDRMKFVFNVQKLYSSISNPFVNGTFVFPRLAKGLINAGYGTKLPNVMEKVVYLLKLSEAGVLAE